MKKTLGALSFLMILTLAACSNNNDAELVADNVVERKEKEEPVEETNKETEENEDKEEKKEREIKAERDQAKEKAREEEKKAERERKRKEREEEREKEIVVKQYTDEEQMEMWDMFYEWAVGRAEIGAMAVTKEYFNHGAAGHGDWVAQTPHGQVQTQDLNNPGYHAFDLHAIGGVAFYTPLTGDYGRDENHDMIITASGYSTIAVPNTNIHKYMLVDNGVVYELITESVSLSNGFAEYTDDGKTTDIIENHLVRFEVSQDTAAQEEWQRILSLYQ